MRITRWVLVGLVLSLLVVSPTAAKIRSEIVKIHTGMLAVADGPAISVDTFNTAEFHVTIATTATVSFETSGDGSAWVNLVCINVSDIARTKVVSTTASGVFQCQVAGLMAVRDYLDRFWETALDNFAILAAADAEETRPNSGEQ